MRLVDKIIGSLGFFTLGVYSLERFEHYLSNNNYDILRDFVTFTPEFFAGYIGMRLGYSLLKRIGLKNSLSLAVPAIALVGGNALHEFNGVNFSDYTDIIKTAVGVGVGSLVSKVYD